MSRILIGVAGEGRGHATRTRGLADLLEKEGHEIDILAGGWAYDLLYERYGAEKVKKIPVPRFHYRKNRLSYIKTIWNNLPYIIGLFILIRHFKSAVNKKKPDLIISDFEPLTARLAKKMNIPLVVLDHQHFLVVADMKRLPWWLRLKAWPLIYFIKFYCPVQKHLIISSFFRFKKKSKYKNLGVQRIGLIPRDIIADADPKVTNKVLVYFRDTTPKYVLKELSCQGYDFVVYGLGRLENKKHVVFKGVCEDEFVQDLINCKAVITNSGNQLLGEALFLGKPVMALPEEDNVEQRINAHFLEQSGCGVFLKQSKITKDHVRVFLERDYHRYMRVIPPPKIDGRKPVLKKINEVLEEIENS